MNQTQMLWVFVLSLAAFAIAYRVPAIGGLIGVRGSSSSTAQRAAAS